MALIFMDGFDNESTAAMLQEKWKASVASINVFQTSTRTGRGQYVRMIAGQGHNFSYLFPAKSTLITGFAFRVGGLPAPNSSNNWLVKFRDGGTDQIGVWLDTFGRLALARGEPAILVASTKTINPNVWYFLEFKTTIADTNGRGIVKIDGEEWINYTGDTKNSANAYANVVYFGCGINFATPFDIDDFYLLDDSGTFNNDFLGDVTVETLFVNGAGNYSQWTPSAGSNYQCVDEYPGYNTSDYVAADTAGQVDTYAMSDLPQTGGTIYGVQLNIIHQKNDAGTRTLKRRIRMNVTDYDGSNFNPAVGWQRYLEILEKDPTGSNWTVSSVNGLELGQVLVA